MWLLLIYKMAAEGMSLVKGGQDTDDGKIVDGQQRKRDCINTVEDKKLSEKNVKTTTSQRNVGDLLIAIGEIFGDELVPNRKKVINRSKISSESDSSTNSIGKEIESVIETSQGQLKSKYCCTICQESFKKNAELKEHLFVHNGHFKFKCQFENCGWSFKTKYKLERHQAKHSAVKKFICPVETCSRSFTEAYKLKSHVESHSALYKCQDCDVACSTFKSLQNHKTKAHSRKLFKCVIAECSEVFTSKSEREDHVKSHRRFVCPFPGCQKPFTRKSYLDVHARSHTNERPYKCNFQGCFATFTTSSKLNRHQKSHASSKPFVCPFKECESSFKRRDNLSQHISMHHSENKFPCPYPDCSSTFSAKSSLKEHMSRHTKQDIYRCPVEGCTKTYFSKNVLGTHIKRHQRKIEKEESQHEQDCRSVLIEAAHKTQEVGQHTEISVNEILIPAKADPTAFINYGDDVTGINPENTVISLGEAVCFQYMNSSDRLPVARDENGKTEDQGSTKLSADDSHQTSSNSENTMQTSSISTSISSASYDPNSSQGADLSTHNQPIKENVDIEPQEPKSLASKYMNATELGAQPNAISSSLANISEADSTVESSSTIFSSGAVTIPLSMTRFLPRDTQVNEIFHSDFSDDHAYNRSLLPVDPRTSTTCDTRSIDNVIETALTASEFDSLSVSSTSEPLMEMRSFLIENGMASFLANDDIGRMETCTSQEELGMSRTYERSQDIASSMMLDECTMNHQSGSLNPAFSHFASNDSYICLMGSSQIVNEHLLNISSNPTMIDHMYSQHSPEEDDLQMTSEDHVYEESTVNIQDIR